MEVLLLILIVLSYVIPGVICLLTIPYLVYRDLKKPNGMSVGELGVAAVMMTCSLIPVINLGLTKITFVDEILEGSGFLEKRIRFGSK